MRKLIYLLLLLVGCGFPAKDSTAEKKQLRIAYSYDPFSIDPRKSSDPVTCNLCFMLYEGLTHLNPDGTISLAIAKKVEVSKDLKTYTFHLKKTFWSDGSRVTAHDFEASWKSILEPHFTSSSAHLLFPIKNAKEIKMGNMDLDQVGIKALNKDTLVVTLEQPIPYFLELIAYCTFFPIHPSNVDKLVQKESVVSNGPFKLAYWNYNNDISVHKNPLYYSENTVLLDEIHISIIKDENTSLQMYEHGELDWLGGFTSPISLDALGHLSQTGELLHQPIGGTTFCTFNLECFPLNNLNIRKGLALAIDRESIVTNITGTHEEIATGMVPPILKKNAPCSLYFVDGQKTLAKEYFLKGLEETGLEPGEFPTLTYSYFTSEHQKNIALAIQCQWRQVLGIHVKLQQFELKVFLDHLHRRKYDLAHMSLITQYPDQMNVLERFKDKQENKNYSGWSNEEFTKLLDQSFFAEDLEKRAELLAQAEEILICDMPITPLYFYTFFYLQKPQVHGIEISPLGHALFTSASSN